MKKILIFLIFFSGIGALQADLIMELNFLTPKIKLVIKIKEGKIRYDLLLGNGYGNISRIVNPKTGDDFILEYVPKRISDPSAIFGQTNAVTKVGWPKFQDTDKTEMLNGYEAEIYRATNSDGMTETLWVAKNYPNFQKIKNDLSKLDRRNNKGYMPELNSLSGMPLKLFIPHKSNIGYGADVTLTLLSAREESINDSIFELPKDYPYYGLQSSPSPIGLFNVTTATNLDQWKAAISNLHNDSVLRENWVMRQSDTNTGVRLIISGTNQTWVEFDSNFISIKTKTSSDAIHRIEIQGVGMNIAEIHVIGRVLLKLMGKGESNFNAWCDKIGSHPVDAPLYTSDNAHLYSGRVCGFEILSGHDPEKPWMINFIITDS
jgi:hypothetical protein